MTKVTWPVAQNYCRETYVDMATVESDLDWVRLKAEVTRERLTDIAWVGVYNDIDSWRWSFNDVPLKDTFQTWARKQPDNQGGDESCCAMNIFGNWKDFPCTKLLAFICYNGELDFICFVVYHNFWVKSSHFVMCTEFQ